MGQKTNPNIFHLGINKTWKTEFFEKKRNELPLYIFKDLQIKDYIERFFENHNIILHDYKQHYNNSTLNLYISYFVTPNFDKTKTNILLINELGNKKKVYFKNNWSNQLFISDFQSSWNFDQFKKYYKLRKYFKENCSKNTSLNKNLLVSQPILVNKDNLNKSILNNMFKVLSLFTRNSTKIVTNFSCINKDLTFLKSSQKKNFILLQKFRNTPFLKEGIELLFYVVCSKNSATLLAKFISFQIRKIKRQKFFLSFLKQSLTILLNSIASKTKGIKIILKGRLNGVPRAKHKIIVIGDVPVQSISQKMDYAQTTAHNSNGSYGIKVWIVEK